MDFAAARAAMIESQVRTNDVHDRRIVQAMGSIPRELFVPEAMRPLAYAERDIETSKGRWLWAAREFSMMMKAAAVQEGDRVLDIAPGTGYSSAVLARLGRSVTALEADAETAARTRETLTGLGVEGVEVVAGDLKAGWPKGAPYDVIWVNGSVETVPEAWLAQLAEGGRLTVIVRKTVGRAHVFTRNGGRVASREPFEAAVPLLPGFEAPVGFRF
jgi:protein-L-isoaspartate(D-aspartate) O-methyltransferase